MKQDPHKKREAQKYEHPIASREVILEHLNKLSAPASFKKIADTLGIESSRDTEALTRRLGAMIRDGQLAMNRHRLYAIAKKVELLTGKVSAHPDGFGFLIQEDPEEDDIFLTPRQMRQVFHGDIVRVRVRGQNRRGKTEGDIVEVVERNTRQLVGRYYLENEVALLEPLNRRINHEVIVHLQGSIDCRPGQIVVGEITEQPSQHGVVRAKIIELLGDHLTPGIEVDIALRNQDIPSEWDSDLLAQVDAMPNKVLPKDKADRFDLTELPMVTIDGEDARDFDDAVYCEPRERGGWRLYVAIADVAHYVEVNSDLDRAAQERGTSVYFPQYVVPMLPEKLSNGLCSLKPDVERLALVCEMTLSDQGRITGFDFYEGVIRSHARLTYTQVARVINEEGNPQDPELEELIPHLKDLHVLYEVLLRQRKQRGAIEFDSTEVHFQIADDGRVQSIQPRTRNTAHRIIEECMLCANVCAARFVARQSTPGLFRVHEPPAEEKLEALGTFMERFGIRTDFQSPVAASDYQLIVDQLRHRENGHVLQVALLRSMNQAVYQVQNKGHFGLGYPEYTHFTSPIRRYPDLLTHRLIKTAIYSAKEVKGALRLGRPKKSIYPYDMEQMITLGERTSFTERRADSAVYEVLEWLKCDYISHRVGDILPGVITGVTKFGLFVELPDIFVEGLVHVSTLAGDYYQYDQATQCLTGQRTQTVYGMGDLVEVQVVRVDVDERKVDFEIVSHRPLVVPRGGKGRSGKNKAAQKPGQKKNHKHKKRGPEARKAGTEKKGSTKAGSTQAESRKTGSQKQGAKSNAASGPAASETRAETDKSGTPPKSKSARRRRRRRS